MLQRVTHVEDSTSAASSRDKAFEIFVKRAISGIQKEAWGRSKEVKDIRDACQQFLQTLEEEQASSLPLEELALAVLRPIKLALGSSSAKVVELALGCIHKLVAHAWLQGESTPSGAVDNANDIVADCIRSVARCGEANGTGEVVHLAVIRALLTFATAEHFIAHGDCLLAAVRCVFNLALSSESENIQRTACNALLQMLNTITKRVTQYQNASSACNSGSMTPDSLQRRSLDGSTLAALAQHAHEAHAAAVGEAGLDTVVDTERSRARAAELAALAQQSDLQALERAIEEAAESEYSEPGEAEGSVTAGNGTSEQGSATETPARDNGAAETSADGAAAALQHSGVVTPPVKPHRRRELTASERDVLLVLTAFCKLASREPSGSGGIANSGSELYAQQGRLLALELLVKVLQHPQHAWDHVREEFCRQLRHPLCITLLRNAAAGEPASFQLAVKLLGAVLAIPKLRLGLRAEVGAFYPLLILNPLEAEMVELGTAAVVLGVLQAICSEVQLLVDFFVNYDCDLQSANLYERTLAVLSKLARKDVEIPPQASQQQRVELMMKVANLNDLAVACVRHTIASLDAWSGPLKDAQREEASMGAPLTVDSPGVSNGNSGNDLQSKFSEAERFGAAKATKGHVTKGIALFNSNPLKGVAYLISSGVIEKTPVSVAEFFWKHLASLDKTCLGEYLGHHEDFELSVMHAFVDGERFEGMAIDLALRKLLEHFRLPGEAQKIDRIMLKFAERYCRDNPGHFKTADAAYMLAFAIIMLNTDAHNPLAENRLGKEVFVAMSQQQLEDGSWQAMLPQAEVEAIFDRIVAQEIRVRDDRRPEDEALRNNSRNRLAAALGLASLGLRLGRPIKAAARNKFVEAAEAAVARGPTAGSHWHTSTHAEHTCPMLQVSGAGMLEALSHALGRAPTIAAAEALISSLILMVRLSGLLGLDTLCEQTVTALAAASGVYAPAPPGTLAEARQVAALKAIVGLPLGPEAGLLGSSWPVILRVVSTLEALQSDLTQHAPAGSSASNGMREGSAVSNNPLRGLMQSLGLVQPAANGRAASPPRNTMINKASPLSNSISQLQAVFPGLNLNFPGRRQPDEPPASIRDGPGAALVAWAEGDGAAMLERVYLRSESLDGDAVVVFVRAMCAVSQEELERPLPRVFSLQRLVECAHHNISRIRLIWSKLWAVISAHLVGASCHPLPSVAMYSVDSLRQLVGKLLARSELANFTHQEETLRPFTAVLRLCDDPAVRELTVRCVSQAISAHPRGLGSGWRMALEALSRAAGDGSANVVAQAVEALQVVVEALYRGAGVGNDCLRECVAAIVIAINNPVNADLSAGAVQLLLRCARRLAERPAPTTPYVPASAAENGAAEGAAMQRTSSLSRASSRALEEEAGWPLLMQTLVDVLASDQRTRVVNASTEVMFEMMALYGVHWDQRAWSIMLDQVLKLLFDPALLHRTPLHTAQPMGAGALLEVPDDAAAATLFLTRMDRYFPQLCDQLGKVDAPLASQLVANMVAITLLWFRQPSDHLASAGLHGFQRLVIALMPRLSEAQWNVLLKQLEAAVAAELELVMDSTRSQLDARAVLPLHAAMGTLGSGMGHNRRSSSASQGRMLGYRARCRMLLLLLRALDALLRDCAASLPPEIHLRLLGIVASVVEGAEGFNASTKQLRPSQRLPRESTAPEDEEPSSPRSSLLAVSRDVAEAGAGAAEAAAEQEAVAGAAAASGSGPSGDGWDGQGDGEGGLDGEEDGQAGTREHEADADPAGAGRMAAAGESGGIAVEDDASSRDAADVGQGAVASSTQQEDGGDGNTAADSRTAHGHEDTPGNTSGRPADATASQPSANDTDSPTEQEPTSAAGTSTSAAQPGPLRPPDQPPESSSSQPATAGPSSPTAARSDMTSPSRRIVTTDVVGTQPVQLVTTSHSCWDPMTPALVRVETDGGMMLLAALARSLDQLAQWDQAAVLSSSGRHQHGISGTRASSSGLPAPPPPPAWAVDPASAQQHRRQLEERMWAYCRRVLHTLATCASQVATATPAELEIHNQIGVPAGYAPVRKWDDAVRAPLLVAVLSQYAVSIGSSPTASQEALALFPQLAQLIRCQQPAVQGALAYLMEKLLAPLVDKVASSG